MLWLQAGALSNVKFEDKQGCSPPGGSGEDITRSYSETVFLRGQRETRATSALILYFLIFRIKGVSLWGPISSPFTELYREKPCLPARKKEALLMNCCSMIPIPLSFAVNDDINCYCYIMLTFRVLQNWHNVRNGRIKHREANEWCLGKEEGSPFADKRDWLNFLSICLWCTACQNWQVWSRNAAIVEEKGREGGDTIYIKKKKKIK